MKSILISSVIFVISFFANDINAQNIYGIQNGGYVNGYDVTTGDRVTQFYTGNHPYSDLAFGPDGYLYGIQNGGYVNGYDVTTGNRVAQFYTGNNINGGLAFGPDGYLYGMQSGGAINVYDVTTGNRINQFSTDIYSDSGLAFQTSVVPEPISSILFVTGGVLLVGRRFIRKA